MTAKEILYDIARAAQTAAGLDTQVDRRCQAFVACLIGRLEATQEAEQEYTHREMLGKTINELLEVMPHLKDKEVASGR